MLYDGNSARWFNLLHFKTKPPSVAENYVLPITVESKWGNFNFWLMKDD